MIFSRSPKIVFWTHCAFPTYFKQKLTQKFTLHHTSWYLHVKQLSLEDVALVLTTLGSSRDNPGSTPLDPVEIPADDGKCFNIVNAN